MMRTDRNGLERAQDNLIALALARGRASVPQPNSFWQQAAVFVDPLNRTTLAKNTNDGLTATTPIRFWSEVLRRYGTASPWAIPQSTDWHFLSGSPADGSDPIVFSPTMIEQARGRILADYGAAQLVGSGTLGPVTAKNRATGTLLQADLSSVPGAAVNQVIQNTTGGKESRAIIIRAGEGGFFSLSQPQGLSNGVLLGSGEVEVNTWAEGDTIEIFQPDLLDLVQIEPTVASFNLTSSNFFTLWQIGVLDPTSANQVGTTQMSDTMYVSECVFLRREVYRPSGWTHNVVHSNTWANAGLVAAAPVAETGGAGAGLFLFGGGANGLAAVGKLFDGDAVVFGSSSRILGAGIGAIYVDQFLRLSNQVDLEDVGNGAAIYGPGAIDVTQGRLLLNGTTATASLLVGGGITIDGLAQGFTATAASPSVIDGNIAIDPTHIDAAPMGQIWIPGGGAIGTVGD